MTLKDKAIKGVKWTSLSSLITTILQLLQLGILARLLEPSAFGLMALVMVVIGFSQAFLDMGISNAIIHKQKITKDQLSTLYWVNVLTGFFLFFIVNLIAPFIAEFYKEPELTNLILIIGVTFVIQPFGQQFMVLWQKDMKFNEIAKIAIINKLMSLIVSVYLAYKGYGVYSLVYGVLAGVVIQTLQSMYLGLKEFRPVFVFKLSEIRNILSFGAYQMGSNSINHISANIDKIIIGKFIGIEALGFYNLAWQLVTFPLSKINPVINNVAFPLYAKVQYNSIKISHYYTKSLSVLFLLTVPLLVFMFFYSNEIVHLVYGENWNETANLLKILVFVGLLKTVSNPSGSLILAIGRADFGFWWNVFWMILISFTLYFTIYLSKDIFWVAKSLLILSLLTFYIYHRLVQKISGVKYKHLTINFFRIFFSSLMIGYLSFKLVGELDISNNLMHIILGAFIYIILYGCYMLKYEMDTLKLLKKRRM